MNADKKQIAAEAVSLMDNGWTLLVSSGIQTEENQVVLRHFQDTLHAGFKTLRAIAAAGEVSDRLIAALYAKIKNLEEIQVLQNERVDIRDKLIAIQDARIAMYEERG